MCSTAVALQCLSLWWHCVRCCLDCSYSVLLHPDSAFTVAGADSGLVPQPGLTGPSCSHSALTVALTVVALWWLALRWHFTVAALCSGFQSVEVALTVSHCVSDRGRNYGVFWLNTLLWLHSHSGSTVVVAEPASNCVLVLVWPCTVACFVAVATVFRTVAALHPRLYYCGQWLTVVAVPRFLLPLPQCFTLWRRFTL